MYFHPTFFLRKCRLRDLCRELYHLPVVIPEIKKATMKGIQSLRVMSRMQKQH